LELPANVVETIKNEYRGLEYGKITIEVNKTSNKIDVITERRARFNKSDDKYHKG